jgi:hypothetical protein
MCFNTITKVCTLPAQIVLYNITTRPSYFIIVFYSSKFAIALNKISRHYVAQDAVIIIVRGICFNSGSSNFSSNNKRESNRGK